ncbi:MAG: HNH endonuclease [Clostridia bacterium]|nr:HNH endonuclease [Clostridia bacterium]
MSEIWRDIKGYKGLYQVSNLGNVKKLQRRILTKNNKMLMYEEMILKPSVNSAGYYRVILIDKNGNKNRFFVHRLVATAFCPQKPNCNIVNHKDCNPKNNNSNNLEWVTQSENIKFAIKSNRMRFSKEWYAQQSGTSKSKAVIRTNIKTGEKVHYASISAAKKDGFNIADIAECCKGKRNYHKGFLWEYAEV